VAENAVSQAAPAPPPAEPVAARPRPRRGIWFWAGMLASTTVHAAAIYIAAQWLTAPALEADDDSITVEIVVEAGGQGADAQPPGAEIAQEAEEPAGDAEAAPPDFVPPPNDMSAGLSAAPDFPEPPAEAEQMTTAALVDAVLSPFEPDLVSPPPFPSLKVEPAALPGLDVLATPPRIDVEPADVARPASKAAPAQPVKQVEKPAPKRPEPRTQARDTRRAEPVKRQPTRDEVQKTAQKETQADRRDAPRKPDREKSKAAASTPGGASGGRNATAQSGSVTKLSAGDKAKYGGQVNRHVQRFKRYPAEAERAKATGTVRVSISIDQSGRLSAARIQSGSGHAMLDSEALATVRRASPYPKPPTGFGPAQFSLVLRFAG
ncbi:MAG: TonB family protein, partial [Mesorhizobium sp.]